MRVKLRMDRFNRPPRTTDIVLFVILFVVLFGTVSGLARIASQAADVRRIVERLDKRDATDAAGTLDAREKALQDREEHNRATTCQLLEILQHRAITRKQLNQVLMAIGQPPVDEPELPPVDPLHLIEVCSPYYGGGK